MKKTVIILLSLLTVPATIFAQTHWEFQAVDSDGISTFDKNANAPDPVTLEGILLNNPEFRYNHTPGSYAQFTNPLMMGGQYEIFIQGEASDHAGTVCWMGQNYAVLQGHYYSYTDQQWLDEINRLNRDLQTGYIFRAGDRVRVIGTYLFYKGKLNINETHETDLYDDFTIKLIKPAVGLPIPEEISISDLKNPDNTEIFDATRTTGCEYYQTRLVRINDVNITNPENWFPTGTITIRDPNGLTFPIKLGLGKGISTYPCPTGQIDVIGILDQQSLDNDDKTGYYIWVLNYDGNGLVLTDTGSPRGNLPGDTNSDFIVDLKDYAVFAENWLNTAPGLF